MENMSTREKIGHIWYYYKIHIIVGIIAIALLTSFISSIVTNKKSVLNMTILGAYIDSSKQEQLQKDMISKFVDNPKKTTAEILFIDYNKDSKDQMSMVGIQKFTALLASKSIDILVADRGTFQNAMDMKGLQNLDELKGLNLSGIQGLNDFKVQAGGTSTPGTYGIPAEAVKALSDLGYDTKDKVIGIASNSTHIDAAEKCLNWLLTK